MSAIASSPSLRITRVRRSRGLGRANRSRQEKEEIQGPIGLDFVCWSNRGATVRSRRHSDARLAGRSELPATAAGNRPRHGRPGRLRRPAAEARRRDSPGSSAGGELFRRPAAGRIQRRADRSPHRRDRAGSRASGHVPHVVDAFPREARTAAGDRPAAWCRPGPRRFGCARRGAHPDYRTAHRRGERPAHLGAHVPAQGAGRARGSLCSSEGSGT